MRPFSNVAMGLHVFVLAAAVLAAGCRGKAAPTLPDPVVIERRACLAEPPPEPEPVDLHVCPAPWSACLDRDGLIRLIRYLRALRTYGRDAYTACGPLPADQPEGGATP